MSATAAFRDKLNQEQASPLSRSLLSPPSPLTAGITQVDQLSDELDEKKALSLPPLPTPPNPPPVGQAGIERLETKVILNLEREKGELQRKLNKTLRQLEAEKAKPKGGPARAVQKEVVQVVDEKPAEKAESSESESEDEDGQRVMVSLQCMATRTVPLIPPSCLL